MQNKIVRLFLDVGSFKSMPIDCFIELNIHGSFP